MNAQWASWKGYGKGIVNDGLCPRHWNINSQWEAQVDIAGALPDPPRPLCSLCVPLSQKALVCFCFQQPTLAMLIWRTSLGLLEPLCPSTQKARSAWEFTSPKRMTEGIGVWNSGLLFWVKAPKHNLHSKSSPGGSSWCYLLWGSLKLHTWMASSSSQFYFPQCLIKSPESTSLINHLHTNPLLRVLLTEIKIE